jgi:uncharacterized protein (DUF1499 family)
LNNRIIFSSILISSFINFPCIAADTQINGLKNDRLLPCKAVSNCISTSSVNSVEKYSRPWEFIQATADEEFDIAQKIIQEDKYLKLVDVDKDKGYLRAEAKSAVPPSGIDDIEVLINKKDKIITYRSNSREVIAAGSEIIGDGGSNKNRLVSLRGKLGVKEMGLDDETEQFIKKENSLNFLQKISAASKPSEINFLDNSVPE